MGASHSTHSLRKSNCVRPSSVSPTGCQLPPREALVGAVTCSHSMHRFVPSDCGATNCRPLRTQKLLVMFIQLTAQFRDAAGGWYPPLRRGAYHSTHPFKNPTASGPLQSALRAASFPQGKLWWEPSPALIQCTALFRQIAGRQIAAPYELRNFW